MAYYPTPNDASIVERWTKAGIGVERIARRLGTTVKTVENTYPFELGFTQEESLAVVADVAYKMATSGKYPTMTKFWLEARGGWQTGQTAIAGGAQKPFQVILDKDAVDAEFEDITPKEIESDSQPG